MGVTVLHRTTLICEGSDTDPCPNTSELSFPLPGLRALNQAARRGWFVTDIVRCPACWSPALSLH